ncbi:unnamed protein product [Ectocarpus fasciculatus]
MGRGPHTTPRAMSRVRRTCVSLLCIVGFAKSQSSCLEGTTTLNVSTTAEALELSDSLDCFGSGHFEVNWSGSVLLSQTTTVSNFSSLSVTGVGAEAVIDGGGAVGLFDVNNSSALLLDGVSLIGGSGVDSGGVEVSKSTLLVRNSSFVGNTGSEGGAINSGNSIVLIANTTFVNNTSGSDGGAISSYYDFIVSIEGETTFAHNTAKGDGGAINIHGSLDSDVSDGDGNTALIIKGDTTFASNSAGGDGGAIHSQRSSLPINIEGETSFEHNTATGGGAGAFTSADSKITIEGETTFAHNTASFGGAVYMNNCSLSVSGTAEWTGNVAVAGANSSESDEGTDGGALYLNDASKVVMDDVNASLTNNSAFANGGAIAAMEGSSVTISGPVSFLNNAAQSNGGAVAMFDSVIATGQGTTFTGNEATAGAGGGVYSSVSTASINGSVFTANQAVWGGGMALFSSGSVWNMESPDDSGPVNMTTCVFERNSAEEGGAIYSVAGYDMISDSWFEDNLALGSGGAYLHSGLLVNLDNTTFVGNRAGSAGLAVSSLGILENVTDTTFESNTYYCQSGQYGYDISEVEDEVLGTCRFHEVCTDCAVSCAEIPEGVFVANDAFVPICETIMMGASGNAGATVATLELEPGYYRTSADSREVLQCHQEEACLGGVDTSEYCASGYEGAYCAVCEEDYATGYQHSCASCVGTDKQSALSTAIAFLLVASGGVAFVIADLIRLVDDDNTGGTVSTCGKTLNSFRDRLANGIPLTSIKIVLVAWQIVTQFSSVVNVVYPAVYEKFLSILNLVNFNFGFILSASCFVDTNFYGRLLFATIGPLVVLGALAVTYAVSRSRNRHSPAGIQTAKHKHLSIALFIMFVVYSSVSFNIFQTFVCETLDDGVDYLRADYSLVCSTDTHTAMKVYAGLMIFVYPLGIPAVFTLWLVSNRHDLVKVDANDGSSTATAKSLSNLQPMRDLWAPYKPRKYYFEVVECGRRIALTGLAVFIYPGSSAQVALEVLFAAFFIGVSDVLSPFADPLDAWLYRSGAWVIFISMFLTLLLKVDASDEDSQSQELFAKLLIAAHVGMVVAIAVQAVLSVRGSLVAMRDQPIAKQGFRRSSLAQVCDGESDAGIKDATPWERLPEADETGSRGTIPG